MEEIVSLILNYVVLSFEKSGESHPQIVKTEPIKHLKSTRHEPDLKQSKLASI